jgi:hypothetical protein
LAKQSIAELQREVARLKGMLRAKQERQRLHEEKRKLSKSLHPGRAKFADFVARQFRTGRAKTFKEAVRLAKKAYSQAK